MGINEVDGYKLSEIKRLGARLAGRFCDSIRRNEAGLYKKFIKKAMDVRINKNVLEYTPLLEEYQDKLPRDVLEDAIRYLTYVNPETLKDEDYRKLLYYILDDPYTFAQVVKNDINREIEGQVAYGRPSSCQEIYQKFKEELTDKKLLEKLYEDELIDYKIQSKKPNSTIKVNSTSNKTQKSKLTHHKSRTPNILSRATEKILGLFPSLKKSGEDTPPLTPTPSAG